MDDEETLKNEVSLQPFDPKRDRALLEKWLHAPHVARWWGDPEKTIQEVLAPARGGGDALIVVGSTPAGYVRWQVPIPDELHAAGLHDIPEDAVDIDVAIGEPNYLGCGVASQALHLLIERLCSSEAEPTIIICTSVENRRAIRAYERAGFERDRVFDDPEFGRMWLFVVKSASNSLNSDRLFRWHSKTGRLNCALGEQHTG